MNNELTPTERAYLIGRAMAKGAAMSTGDIAEQFGMSTSGAYRLMMRVCRVAPIVFDGRVWQEEREHPNKCVVRLSRENS